ncbi:CocE/NonD family hydrolase [Amycolatopsis sp. NPDC024027]|uniref:CocE/NonD family hydrolase n=1 Tax=Amycolatopsis sp. NPDC024027 TaxID=3154327 RepID=UPI0033D0B1AB
MRLSSSISSATVGANGSISVSSTYNAVAPAGMSSADSGEITQIPRLVQPDRAVPTGQDLLQLAERLVELVLRLRRDPRPADPDGRQRRAARGPLRAGGTGLGTILVTSPYGWNLYGAAMTGGMFAGRGYRVLLVRCRGTFGSGGTFEPFMREADDAADIVAWMREQPWFDGRFATHGYSYLGFT